MEKKWVIYSKDLNKSQNKNRHGQNKKKELLIEDLNNEEEENNINSSNLNTKEKEIPSLPHNFEDETNPNNKIKIEVEPRSIIIMVEVLKTN